MQFHRHTHVHRHTYESEDTYLRTQLAEVHARLGQVLDTLTRMEVTMAGSQDAIARLTQDVADTHGVVESAITLIEGIPDVVRAAVADALSKNPGADLTALSGLADDLEAEKGKLQAALTANQGGAAGTGGTPTGTTPGGVGSTTGAGSPPADSGTGAGTGATPADTGAGSVGGTTPAAGGSTDTPGGTPI